MSRLTAPIVAALGGLFLLPAAASADDMPMKDRIERWQKTVTADDPCKDYGFGGGQGPVTASFADGDRGQARRLCGRSEVAATLNAGLLIDEPNFYGRLVAGTHLEGSLAIGDRFELFGDWEFFRYETAITPIPATFAGLGHFAIGGTYRFLAFRPLTVGVTGRFVFPTTWLYQNAAPIGVDIAALALFAPHRTVHVHLQLGAQNSFAVGRGDADPRLGAAINAGVELRPVPGFGVVVDVQANMGHDAPLDMLALAFALRANDGRRFGFELGATIPLAGRERGAAAIDFRWSVRFGKIQRVEMPGGVPPEPIKAGPPGA